MKPETRGHLLDLLWVGGLVTLVLLVFGAAAGFDFVQWDDDINIYANPNIRRLDGEALAWMFTDSAHALRYSPLSWLTWALVYALGGHSPDGFHLLNLVLHSSNVCLVFFLTCRVLRLAGVAGEAGSRLLDLISGLAALAWGLHPLRAEAVAWATGMRYLLSTLFALLALLAYLSRTGSFERRWWTERKLWLSALFFALSLLTYPPAVPLPAVLLVLDATPLRRWGKEPVARILAEKIPFLVTAFLIGGATLVGRLIGGGEWLDAVSFEDFGIADRLAQAAYVWAYYLVKPLWPTDLSILYTRLIKFEPFSAIFLASALALAAISIALLGLRRRMPSLTASWFAYLLLLVPVLGLTEHPHYTNDRYSYLPGIVWSVFLAGAFLKVPRQRGGYWLAAAVLPVAILGISCRDQVSVWRDTESLLGNAISLADTDNARNDLRLVLGLHQRRAGRPERAAATYGDILAVTPANRAALRPLLEVLLELNQSAQAERVLRTALVQNESSDFRSWLGTILAVRKDFERAHSEFARATALDPSNHEAYFGLARVFLSLGQPQAASGALARCLELRPGYQPAIALGKKLEAAGIPIPRNRVQTERSVQP